MTNTAITLIRHGQANSEAKSEADYDRLSDIGHTQAEWLGQYLQTLDVPYDRMICGDLNRHQQTARSMNMGIEPEIDPRVNEMRYFDMAHELQSKNGTPVPQGPTEFGTHLPLVLDAWEQGQLDDVHIPLAQFKDNFKTVVRDCLDQGGHTIIVTSGGVIGTFIAAHLGMAHRDAGAFILPIFNTSIHRFVDVADAPRLQTYNSTPHLDQADRIHARTHV